jgi:hypothetical protein
MAWGFSLLQEDSTMSNNTKGQTAITMTMLEKEFTAVYEELCRDISAVMVTLTRDVHFDAYNCEVSVYGSDSDNPIVCEVVEILRDIVDEESQRAGKPLAPSAVLSLFAADTLGLLKRRGIMIDWNPDWMTEAKIDLTTAKSTDRLYPEDQ